MFKPESERLKVGQRQSGEFLYSSLSDGVTAAAVMCRMSVLVPLDSLVKKLLQ